jgi:hypothetical protein
MHTITISTVATFSKRIPKSKNLSFDPVNDWPTEVYDYSGSVTRVSDPQYIEEISESREEWVVTAKASIHLTRTITTSDDEYKAWKLIYWDEEVSEDDVTVKPNTNEFFEIIDDNSDWVEDDEEDPSFV